MSRAFMLTMLIRIGKCFLACPALIGAGASAGVDLDVVPKLLVVGEKLVAVTTVEELAAAGRLKYGTWCQ